MPRKPKVAVIGIKGLPSFVGAGTAGEHIINNLKNDFDFYVYSISSHTHLKSGPYNGVYQKVFKKLPFLKLNGFWYYLISALHARFKGNYDVIHLHNSFAAFSLLFLKPKYRVVLTTHGSFNIVDKWKKFEWFWNANNKFYVKKADRLCCVSKFEKRKYKDLFKLDAQLIPNGIDPVNAALLPSIDHKDYIFFAAGRIIRSKGLHDLIQALRQIDYKGHLLVAGDMNQIKDYSEELYQLKGDLNVTFLGMIKEKEKLLSYLSKATLFIYPSYVEAMSMMLMEAVTVNCPVVCSDIIGNKDILNEDEVLFFKVRDVNDIANKVSWALSNIEEMKKKANKAKERFLKEYNWDNIAEEYKSIYNQLNR
ncbi:glycosyltransferase family 4 protein [Plebeiibacterium sediminum]|uniref:Glycosyltransferase family 4 protein n=1 Tax=Plebeiibacterium sediminum TaxID=2992112 RepID=A0AAE3M340_9BACT|nr:glycosyltransferase family 4 protein [Plebeiobacterium sediminum]MCW3786239.1 glycosyltransferase family 4 protein [Plebeiobacterium sediminum]